MIILRIDDVGRAVNQPADGEPDRDLRYFWQWREALGLAGLPVVYGVIPCAVTRADVLNLHAGLSGGEELAVHGWTHRDGEIVTADMMRQGIDLLTVDGGKPVRSYIPPFNRYDGQTVADWGTAAPGGYFLGGQHPRDQFYGHLPTKIGGTWHIGAFPALYGHAHELVRRLDVIERWGATAVPVVLTLHTVWDVNHLGEARRVVEAARPFLGRLDALPEFRVNAALKIGALTRTEGIAVKWMRDNVQPLTTAVNLYPNDVIDGLLEFMGCNVVRDAADESVDYAIDYLQPTDRVDQVIYRLRGLWRRLNKGGRLFVFTRYAPRDPAPGVLCAHDHDAIAYTISDNCVADFTFRGGDNAERTVPEDADHLFYCLQK